MPRRSVPLPPGALLTRAQWLGLGMSARRLAGPELVRVLPGYWTPAAAPASLDALCYRLQRTVLPGAVISDATAAALMGWPLPWWWERGIGLLAEQEIMTPFGPITPSAAPVPLRPLGASAGPAAFAERRTREIPIWLPPPLHCTLPREGPHRAGPNVTVHRRLHPGEAFLWRGIMLSHPVEVLCQIAGSLPHDDLVVVLDHLLGPNCRRKGLTCDEILAALDARAGHRGTSAVKAALTDARSGVESAGETRLRLLLGRAGFPEPVVNLAVPDPDRPGSSRRIDLGYPEEKIGAEYQGDYHRTRRDQWRADEGRRDSLASVGWQLREATADDITAPARFLNGMRRAFLAAGAEAPPASNWLGDAGASLARRSAPPRR